MSFYTSNRTTLCCPGPISGNPLNGLCEKVCIHTTKVFDSCLRQVALANTEVTTTLVTPTPTEPLTFVSANTNPNVETTVTNLIVDRIADRPNYARVSGTAVIPYIVNFTDANGVAGSATATVDVPFDVILFVPQASIIPYKVEAFGALNANVGRWVSGTTFILDLCITLIIRVTVEADLCLPSYGYCEIPPCIEFTQDVCAGVFELPLYPTAIN